MTTRSTSRKRRTSCSQPITIRIGLTDVAELLDFATKWEPFGGPPETDIYVTFGLTPDEYRARLAQARDQQARRTTV